MSVRVTVVRDLTLTLPTYRDTPAQTILDGDLPALAETMLDAYRGTVDDEGEDEAAALHELETTAEGAYGAPLRGEWLAISSARVCSRRLCSPRSWMRCHLSPSPSPSLSHEPTKRVVASLLL